MSSSVDSNVRLRRKTPREYMKSLIRKEKQNLPVFTRTTEDEDLVVEPTRGFRSLSCIHKPGRDQLKLPTSLGKLFAVGRSKRDIPATSFPKFLQLPAELRLCIWKWALSVPQIVAVTMHDVLIQSSTEGLDDDLSFNFALVHESRRKLVPDGLVLSGFLSTTPNHSPLLRVNSESRYEAQKKYLPVGYHMPGYCQPRLNNKIDYLWITDPRQDLAFSLQFFQIQYLQGCECTKIALPWSFYKEVVAHMDSNLNVSFADRYGDPMHRWIHVFLEDGHLKELMIVIGNESSSSYSSSFSIPTTLPNSQSVESSLSTSFAEMTTEHLEEFLLALMNKYQKAQLAWLESIGHNKVPGTIQWTHYIGLLDRIQNWQPPIIKIRQID